MAAKRNRVTIKIHRDVHDELWAVSKDTGMPISRIISIAMRYYAKHYDEPLRGRPRKLRGSR